MLAQILYFSLLFFLWMDKTQKQKGWGWVRNVTQYFPSIRKQEKRKGEGKGGEGREQEQRREKKIGFWT
jgi:hypothetical protein